MKVFVYRNATAFVGRLLTFNDRILAFDNVSVTFYPDGERQRLRAPCLIFLEPGVSVFSLQ